VRKCELHFASRFSAKQTVKNEFFFFYDLRVAAFCNETNRATRAQEAYSHSQWNQLNIYCTMKKCFSVAQNNSRQHTHDRTSATESSEQHKRVKHFTRYF